MMRKCLSYVPTHIVAQVATSLISCHLDYCAPVWSSASKGQLKKLQTDQNRAARLVLHCSIRTNTVNMHRQLSWLTVENRLVFNTTTFFRSLSSLLNPFSYITKLLDLVSFILILLGQPMMARGCYQVQNHRL